MASDLMNRSSDSSSTTEAAPPTLVHGHHHFGLALIAIFKFIKGFLLLAAAIGCLRLLHTNLSTAVERWITALRMDPDNHCFHWLLERVASISPHHLRVISAGSFCYSALLLTEGIGLWLERRWAEYLTVIATSSFIPLEIYEICRDVNGIRLGLLAINVAIVAYLVRTLQRQRKSRG